jgi:hypothetical protein
MLNMNKKMILFNVTPLNTDVTDLSKFEEKVAKAKESGATHILVTEVEKSRWIWERDRSDPYPNWGMLYSSLFKIIVPDELKKWLPLDYAQRNFELVRARAEICRHYGLKCAAYFTEPFYLPEEVYRVYPDYRGPRCDHPRRARNSYYSPCTDNPKVLDMYRQAMRKLCEVCDIDYVYLYTNDSGAGLCWSSGLYDGLNGPEHCRNISMAQRIIGFFKAFRQGASDAGRKIMIETNNNIGLKSNERTMDSVWPLLEDGTAVNYKTNKNTPLSSLVDVNYEYTFAPVRNIPLIMMFLEQLEQGWREESEVLRIVIMDDDWDEYYKIAREFFSKPTDGLKSRVDLLSRVAEQIAGISTGKSLVEVWNQVEMGRKHFFDAYNEGLSWCSVNQRLINRPFVLFPSELTPDEKDYYRPFQFQANDEQHTYDLMDNQCTTFIRGHYAAFLATRSLGLAMNCMANASKICREAAENLGGGTNEKFRLGSDRLKLLNCFIQNYIDAIRFQKIVDSTDYSASPEVSSMLGISADPRLTEFEWINRMEVDNTYTLIGLIQDREAEMLVLAPSEELEDCFWLSPKITEQLKKRADIMLNHQLDGKRMYVTYN